MKKIAYLFSLVVFVLGCKDTTDDGPIDAGNGRDLPEGVQLIFPFEDSLCNEGTNLTPTESTVYFEWAPNDNAEIYILHIENLTTGDITQYETVDFILPVTIPRAYPFRWFVEYNYQNETKISPSWNFYNAGAGLQNYAPFPAEIISPTMAQTLTSTTSLVLQWTGNDVDDDIVSYDVYFGTNNPPTINTSDISSNQLTVAVAPSNIYYWEVVTKDASGNSSESGIYQFKVLE
jgi:hypothetical protein